MFVIEAENLDHYCANVAQDGADRTFCWHQGTTLPSLQPPPTPPPSDDDENEQPSDADVLKEDVIKVCNHDLFKCFC